MAIPQNQPTKAEESTSSKLMDKAESQVRENENASLQDESYSFDEANTGNEEYHDVDDEDFEDFDLDDDDDFIH